MSTKIDQLWAEAPTEGWQLQILLGSPIREVGRFYIDADGDLAFGGKIKDTLRAILRQPLCTLKALCRLVRTGMVVSEGIIAEATKEAGFRE